MIEITFAAHLEILSLLASSLTHFQGHRNVPSSRFPLTDVLLAPHTLQTDATIDELRCGPESSNTLRSDFVLSSRQTNFTSRSEANLITDGKISDFVLILHLNWFILVGLSSATTVGRSADHRCSVSFRIRRWSHQFGEERLHRSRSSCTVREITRRLLLSALADHLPL